LEGFTESVRNAFLLHCIQHVILGKSPENMVNSAILSVEGSLMADYSRSRSVAQDKTTIYGVDTAIVIVVFASTLFWLSVGVAVWLFF
jgi:hypothetical protein